MGNILPTLLCFRGIKLIICVAVSDRRAVSECHQCGNCNVFQDERRLYWITVVVRLTQFELEDKTNPIAPLPIYLQPQTWHQCKYLQCRVSWAGDGSHWQWKLIPVPLWLNRLTPGKRVTSLTSLSFPLVYRHAVTQLRKSTQFRQICLFTLDSTQKNIPSNSQETSLQTHTHIFSLEVVKMLELLTDLNWKWKWGGKNI